MGTGHHLVLDYCNFFFFWEVEISQHLLENMASTIDGWKPNPTFGKHETKLANTETKVYFNDDLPGNIPTLYKVKATVASPIRHVAEAYINQVVSWFAD